MAGKPLPLLVDGLRERHFQNRLTGFVFDFELPVSGPGPSQNSIAHDLSGTCNGLFADRVQIMQVLSLEILHPNTVANDVEIKARHAISLKARLSPNWRIAF
jgi:hypothetical protein